MITLSETLRRHFRFFDVLLFAVGFALLLVYFAVLPAQHPDGAAVSDLGETEVAERAEAMLVDQGFVASSTLRRDVRLVRDVRLLDSLQAQYGRPETVRLLRETPDGLLPTYYWRTTWEASGNDGEGDTALRVDLTLDGRPYGFYSDGGYAPARRVDRSALLELLRSTEPGDEAAALAPGIPDSMLVALLSFDLATPVDFSQPGPVGRAAGGDAMPLHAALGAGRPAGLNARAAVALARYHLRRTVLGELPFQVDSVRTASRPGAAAAVHLSATRAYYGQRLKAIVEVSAGGGLLSLEPVFNAEVSKADAPEGTTVREEEGSRFSLEVTAGGVADVVMGLLYVALIIMALFMFIRRLNARVVDTRQALRDGLWGGCFVGGLVLATTAQPMFASIDEFWLAFVILSANVSIAGLGSAFLIFIASGAMDSLARSVWPDKLATLGLVRHGLIRNVPVGAALLRGTFTAFVLVGGSVVLLALIPDAGIDFGDGDRRLTQAFVLATASQALGKWAWFGLFLGFTVHLGVGSLLVQARKTRWLVVPGLALLLLLLQVPPYAIEPLGYYALFSGFVGVVLAYAFWRYDFVTATVAFALFGLLWETQSGWLVPGSTLWFDAVAAFALAGLCVFVGLVGTLSRKTATEVPDFTPSYILELAREERMKGELEIANQVQASFLPRRMPATAGLDVAAMCLPAQETGGDYYDFVELAPHRLAIAVGDVSGKGIQAAFYMTLVKGFLQTLCRTVESPAEVLRRLNGLFYENAPRGTFISMIFGVLDVEARTFTFARAGHNPVILKRSPSQEPELFQPAGLGIGLVAGARFDDTIVEEVIHLRPGDALVFYTDGFSEAMNLHKQLYGDARLARRVSEMGQRNASEILRAVSEDVHHFMEAAGRHDDMTMVVVKLRTPAAQAQVAAGTVAQARA